MNLADKLSAAGVEFQSDGSDPETGGTWDTWQKSLHDFAQRVFQDPGDTGPSEGHLPLEPHSLPAAGTTPTPWIDENGVVTFETGTEFAGANNVTVWGNFGPAGSWPRTPMTLQEDGRWRLTMPVEAGSYYYKFVVEGVDQKDQTNPTSVLSEPNWSTFQVPGDETLRGEFTTPVAPENRGSVEVLNYTSTANGNPERSAYVWTPPDYDPERAEAYPVFYLQHGGGQTWTDWIEVGFAAQILDNHYAQGNIVPMVVVMANGNGVNFPNEITQRITVAAEARTTSAAKARTVPSPASPPARARPSARCGRTRASSPTSAPCRRSAAFPAARTWRRSTTGPSSCGSIPVTSRTSPMERR